MRLFLALTLLVCLWMVSEAHRGGYRGRSKFSSWGRRGSWTRPSYQSGYKQCMMARKACLVTKEDGAVLRNEACQNNNTCSRGPVQIEKDGVTYNFTFCDGYQTRKYNVCMPSCSRKDGKIPELPEPTDPEGGNGETPNNGGSGTNNGESERLTQGTLPPADESEAEDLFCQHQIWYLLACRVTETDGGASVKENGCSRGGACTLGPGQYNYNGTAVQAFFCEGCQQWNPRQKWGGRPSWGRKSGWFRRG